MEPLHSNLVKVFVWVLCLCVCFRESFHISRKERSDLTQHAERLENKKVKLRDEGQGLAHLITVLLLDYQSFQNITKFGSALQRNEYINKVACARLYRPMSIHLLAKYIRINAENRTS